MEPNCVEFQKQCILQSFCKRVLHNEACNAHDEIRRHKSKGGNFFQNCLIHTQPGDIILYQGRTLVIYYDTNSWGLTPIAKIDNVDATELKKALGDEDVTVIFSSLFWGK